MHQITIPKHLKILNSYKPLLDSISEILDGSSAFLICGENSFDLLAKDLVVDLELGHFVIKHDEIDKEKMDIVGLGEVDWVIGLGGGKVLDFAKYLAFKHDKKFISIPTLISHDGICSPVAVVKGESLAAAMPSALLVPLFLIKDSPIKYTYAGIGDLVANLSAIEDWKLAHQNNAESIDDFAVMLSKNAAMNVLKAISIELNRDETTIIEFLNSTEFQTTLIESVALSGIAMSISGNSRPCSGAEHMISHAIDAIYGPGSKALHGIQVLVATLYLEKFRGLKFAINDYSLKDLMSKIQAPVDFTDIQVNEEDLEQVIERAPNTRKDRYTVLSEISVKKD